MGDQFQEIPNTEAVSASLHTHKDLITRYDEISSQGLLKDGSNGRQSACQEIGHALVEYIGVMPGSNLSLEAKQKIHSTGTVGVSENLTDMELENLGEHAVLEATADLTEPDVTRLNIRRRSPDGRCAVNLDYDDKGVFHGGSMFFQTKDVWGTVLLDSDGSVNNILTESGTGLSKFSGKKIEIPKFVNQVTTRGQLGQVGDIAAIFNSVAVLPKQ